MTGGEGIDVVVEVEIVVDVDVDVAEVVVVVVELVVESAAPAGGGVEEWATRNTVNVMASTATAIAEYVIRRRITSSKFRP